jgi:hypothetical protein
LRRFREIFAPLFLLGAVRGHVSPVRREGLLALAELVRNYVFASRKFSSASGRQTVNAPALKN